MNKLPIAAAAAAVACVVAFSPLDAFARGGGGGFMAVRGALALRGAAARPLLLRRALLARWFHNHHHHNGSNAGASEVFAGTPDTPAYDAGDYGGFYQPPPIWRECISETNMVPSSTHRGPTPVVVTRCWRRN